MTRNAFLENCIQDGLVGGEAPLSWAGEPGQACFQGFWAQILTWAAESPLPHHEPILWKDLEKLNSSFRITCDLHSMPSSGGCGKHMVPISFPDPGDFGQMLFQIFLLVRGPCFAVFRRCFAFPVASPLWTGLESPDVGFTGSMVLQWPSASLCAFFPGRLRKLHFPFGIDFSSFRLCLLQLY